MFINDRRAAEALDRYITGDYGARQFRGDHGAFTIGRAWRKGVRDWRRGISRIQCPLTNPARRRAWLSAWDEMDCNQREEEAMERAEREAREAEARAVLTDGWNPNNH